MFFAVVFVEVCVAVRDGAEEPEQLQIQGSAARGGSGTAQRSFWADF